MTVFFVSETTTAPHTAAIRFGWKKSLPRLMLYLLLNLSISLNEVRLFFADTVNPPADLKL
jgi:hypothetical protein